MHDLKNGARGCVCSQRRGSVWRFFFNLKIVNGNRLTCRVSFNLGGCGVYVS